ncbi:MAG: sensor histidine kinase [Vicinamibacterales bacterium]
MAVTTIATPRPERIVLHDFVARYRDDIIARTREKLGSRPAPVSLPGDLENGVPLFLRQLSDTLKHELSGTRGSPSAIGDSATAHGGEMLSRGFTVSEVVHTYGDICQAVTELAVELDAPISTEEFHTLNRCLDTAIAEAVTEHARLTAQSRSTDEVERLGQVVHEMRNHLNSALLAFDSLRRGTVAVNGSTGAVLGRSLLGLRDVLDYALADIRMSALPRHRETLKLPAFLADLAVAAALHAEYRRLTFSLAGVPSGLAITADPHLLGSAVTNLLNNAFKFTHAGGRVVLSASADDSRVYISVEDECGGIPDSVGDPFQPFGDRRGDDRSGLGLGLSIARKAIRSHGGDITIRNLPGTGCVFTIDLPIRPDSSGDIQTLQVIIDGSSDTQRRRQAQCRAGADRRKPAH